MKKPLRHIVSYIVLCLALAVIIALLIYTNGSPAIQKQLVLLGSAWYVGWGIYHHAKEKTLDLFVTFEYLLYSILGSVIIFGLLK